MDAREQVSAVADLMKEFGLSEARLEQGELTIAFKKKRTPVMVAGTVADTSAQVADEDFADEAVTAPASGPTGLPVSSPMTGIYYGSPSPSAPMFVKEGDTVNAGQVVALIEAMKVFNEIVAPTSGTIVKVIAKSGDIVNPGDPLLYIG